MTSPAPPSAATAGWYADPHGLPALRWWDGREWTSHIQPGTDATPPVTPDAAPTGSPVPGAHTAEPAGQDVLAPGAPSITAPSLIAPSITAPSVTARTGGARAAFAAAAGYSMQPVDSISARLGSATPATAPAPEPAAAPAEVAAPGRRAVVVGAISLLINPLLLCSVYAIVMGIRGLPESRRAGILAIALGAGGVVTHGLLILLLILRL